MAREGRRVSRLMWSLGVGREAHSEFSWSRVSAPPQGHHGQGTRPEGLALSQLTQAQKANAICHPVDWLPVTPPIQSNLLGVVETQINQLGPAFQFSGAGGGQTGHFWSLKTLRPGPLFLPLHLWLGSSCLLSLTPQCWQLGALTHSVGSWGHRGE